MHVPVLLRPAIKGITDGLKKNTPSIVLDATFGNGGYTRLLLEDPNIKVIALDRDAEAIERAFKLKKELKDPDQLLPMHGTFSQIPQLLKQYFPERTGPFLDGMVFDIGVSSNQLDDPKRGFSYKHDGPLDMRMHQDDEVISAETIVNNFSEEEIANIITEFGQDRKAKKIARTIVLKRKEKAITRTVQLADIVKEAVVGKNGSWNVGQRHPAVRTFQALRIYINQELSEFLAGLRAAELFLVPKARLSTVTFHSLEDRIAKRFFLPELAGSKDKTWRKKAELDSPPEIDWDKLANNWEEGPISLDYSHLIPEAEELFHTFQVLSRKVIKPCQTEVLSNPRSRSARLRIAERTHVPWTLDS